MPLRSIRSPSATVEVTDPYPRSPRSMPVSLRGRPDEYVRPLPAAHDVHSVAADQRIVALAATRAVVAADIPSGVVSVVTHDAVGVVVAEQVIVISRADEVLDAVERVALRVAVQRQLPLSDTTTPAANPSSWRRRLRPRRTTDRPQPRLCRRSLSSPPYRMSAWSCREPIVARCRHTERRFRPDRSGSPCRPGPAAYWLRRRHSIQSS